MLIINTGSTNPRSLQHNREPGTVIIGAWIGMFCRRVIDGKIRSWAGNRRLIACRVLISILSLRRMPFFSPRSKDTNTSFKSPTSANLFQRHTLTISCTSPRSLNTSELNRDFPCTVYKEQFCFEFSLLPSSNISTIRQSNVQQT